MSWVALGSAVIGAGGSYLAAREKRKGSKGGGGGGLYDIRSPESKQLGTTFLASLQRGTEGFKPGADFGDVNVPLTAQERGSLGSLDRYTGGDITKSVPYSEGRESILGTLQGKYDPRTSLQYQAFRAESEREKQSAISQARRGQAARGAFRSTGGLRQEADILTDVANRRSALLADLSDRERARQFQAAGQAVELGKFEFEQPLRKTQAAQTFGALERLNRIANLEREYRKFLNQRQERLSLLPLAGQSSGYGSPVYGTTNIPQGGGGGGLMSGLAPVVGSFLGGLNTRRDPNVGSARTTSNPQMQSGFGIGAGRGQFAGQ